MNASSYALRAAEDSLLTEAETNNLASQASNLAETPNLKLGVQIDDDAERIRSSIALLTSLSIDELERLVTDIQEVREYLKAEGERVQREIMNYAHLSQTAIAASKQITETFASLQAKSI
jgi:hypothetical protein